MGFLEKVIEVVRSAPSLDENGYVAEKSQIINALHLAFNPFEDSHLNFHCQPDGILLVGGHSDGKRVSAKDRESVIHSGYVTPIADEVLQAESAGFQYHTEVYTLWMFISDNDAVLIYGHESLSDIDVQLALLRGYHTRATIG